MASAGSISVQRMRERRRSEGIREATVWIHQDIERAVEDAVRSGRFATKKEAMTKAIETFFTKKEHA